MYYLVGMESDPPPHDTQKEQCDERTSFQVSVVYRTDLHFIGMDSDPPPREVQKEQHDKGIPFQG